MYVVPPSIASKKTATRDEGPYQIKRIQIKQKNKKKTKKKKMRWDGDIKQKKENIVQQ